MTKNNEIEYSRRKIIIGATPLLSMGVIGKIFVAKKYLVTPSVFKLTKWFLHQNGVEFNHKSKSDQVLAGSRTGAGRPWT